MDHVATVIALALHLYMEDLYSSDQMRLTIEKVIRPYSPWSSKIYGLRQVPPRFTFHKPLSLKIK